MKKVLWMSAAVATVLISFTGCGSESLNDTKESVMGSTEFKVALWGDQFYSDDATLKASMKEKLIASIDAHNVAMTLFAGDSKNGSTACTDQTIGQDFVDVFNSFNVPSIYSLGDNEWTDCHRINNGGYDPLNRLNYLRQTFFASSMSQGKNPVALERQGSLGAEYSENSRMTMKDITFVSLHIIGSNNNLVKDGTCLSTTSVRTEADCLAANAEYEARNAKNIAWLKESFAQAKAQNNAGIMILIQANPGFENTKPTENGFIDFINTLRSETETFNGKVVLVHGDSHYFRIDKPLRRADKSLIENFTRVEVFGSSEANWVEATIDQTSPNLFHFDPVIVSQDLAASY